MSGGSGKLRWGILGTGGIARKMALAMGGSNACELVAIAGRRIESAARLSADFQGVKSYGTYRELLDDPRVDAVYVALPNHLHCEWVVTCARAGRHILCEKPFTINRREAETAFSAVEKAGTFCMEAFMYRCHPQTSRIREIVASGALGQIRLIQIAFSFLHGSRTEGIRVRRETGGGSILDVGCYVVSMSRLIAGAAQCRPFLEPLRVSGAAVLDETAGIDVAAAVALEFPNGIVASLATGIQCPADRSARVFGSDGSLVIVEPWIPGKSHNLLTLKKTKNPDVEGEYVDCDKSLFVNEIDLATDCIQRGLTESEAMSWSDTLGNMTVLDTWREQVKLRFPSDLNQIHQTLP